MMKKVIIICILSCVPIFMFAQGTSLYVGGQSQLSHYMINSSGREKPDIKGTPYYNKDFMYGELTLKDNKRVKGMFRYNIYYQELEFIYKQDTFIINDPSMIKDLEFGGKKFVFSLCIENKYNKDYLSGGYFEYISCDGDYNLLIKRTIDMKENSYVSNYAGGGGDGSQTFIPKLSYYIKNNETGNVQQIKLTRSYFLKLFNDRKKELKMFISSNNIDFSKNYHVIKLIQFYNNLNKKA